ncbi:MAG TPA: nuclease [Lachnospiraceae bacterium]|nr:thermonuclease family protein [uncultured Lachnoclostridium sp.]HAU85112.1 nuclease [Lachnospiraceae bacterium]
MEIKDNYTRRAIVVNVVDGDTVDVDIDLGYYMIARHRVRLLRVNSPEKFGETRQAGFAAKEFTTNELLGKEVFLVSKKTDSFKRWLGEIYYNKDGELRNISDELLKSGNAIEYMV